MGNTRFGSWMLENTKRWVKSTRVVLYLMRCLDDGFRMLLGKSGGRCGLQAFRKSMVPTERPACFASLTEEGIVPEVRTKG